MPQDPAHVYALISVDARVPMRADTKARLESSGFTGVQSVALSGGRRQCAAPAEAGERAAGHHSRTLRTFRI